MCLENEGSLDLRLSHSLTCAASRSAHPRANIRPRIANANSRSNYHSAQEMHQTFH